MSLDNILIVLAWVEHQVILSLARIGSVSWVWYRQLGIISMLQTRSPASKQRNL